MENQTYCAETERLVSNNLFKICLSISLILIISAIVPSIILLLTLLRVVRLYNNVKYMLINMTVAMLIVCILSSIDNIVIVYHAYLMDTPCKLVKSPSYCLLSNLPLTIGWMALLYSLIALSIDRAYSTYRLMRQDVRNIKSSIPILLVWVVAIIYGSLSIFGSIYAQDTTTSSPPSICSGTRIRSFSTMIRIIVISGIVEVIPIGIFVYVHVTNAKLNHEFKHNRLVLVLLGYFICVIRAQHTLTMRQIVRRHLETTRALIPIIFLHACFSMAVTGILAFTTILMEHNEMRYIYDHLLTRGVLGGYCLLACILLLFKHPALRLEVRALFLCERISSGDSLLREYSFVHYARRAVAKQEREDRRENEGEIYMEQLQKMWSKK